LAELGEAVPRGVEVSDVAVCLVRLGDEVFAVHDECTHESVPLSEGDVEGATIECWRHGSRFDLRSGAVLNPPAVKAVQTYAVRVDGGYVQIDVGS
jgi:3-phenylpropionate/trans-cinnamate dioxygenase ferredoxin subunit